MAISTIATTDSPETGRTTINANFQDVLSAFGGSSTAFPKRYVALLTQGGTNAPVATVLENTLGGTVVWTRTSVGDYSGTLTGVFTVNKTAVPNVLTVSVDGAISATVNAFRDSADVIRILVNASDSNLSDDLLIGGDGRPYLLEITVYP